MHLVTDHFRVKVEQSIDPVCVRVLVVRTVRVFWTKRPHGMLVHTDALGQIWRSKSHVKVQDRKMAAEWELPSLHHASNALPCFDAIVAYRRYCTVPHFWHIDRFLGPSLSVPALSVDWRIDVPLKRSSACLYSTGGPCARRRLTIIWMSPRTVGWTQIRYSNTVVMSAANHAQTSGGQQHGLRQWRRENVTIRLKCMPPVEMRYLKRIVHLQQRKTAYTPARVKGRVSV